jgi:chaperonin cofactor prefoldin
MNSILLLCLIPSSAIFMDNDSLDGNWQKPITKVIGLLKDMASQLQKEADEDAEMFEKMGCWCETNDKEKTKAIAEAKKHIEALTASIDAGTAKSSALETELEKLSEEIAKSTSALDQATAIRTKENGEFASDQADMSANAVSLKGAVEALGAAHPGAALSQATLMQIRTILKKHQDQHMKMFSPKQHKVVLSLIQDQGEEMYAPESGAIFGILKQMKEGFETNMADSQTEETRAAEEFVSMKKAKTDQIKAAEDLSKSKTIELGNTKAQLAADKQDMKDTDAQLAADTTFLENVKDTCATADEDYQARQKVRTEEITAVGDTIGVLTDDEAQTAFSKSSSASFIQLSKTRRNEGAQQQRKKAVQLMQKAASKSGDAQLANLASKTKLLDFSEIKKAIDDMMAELKTTQKNEADKYEFCTSEIKANEKETAAKHELKADLEQKIEDLSSSISTLTDEIAALKAEVAQTNVEMKAASQQREAENKDFQTTVADQKATQAILTKAIERMKAFYGFLQTGQTQPKQGTYGKSAGGSHVLNLLQGIIGESADVEKKALKAENEAQAAYESYITNSNAANAAASNSITNKSGEMAVADKDKIYATESRDATIQDLLLLGERNAALHQDCDFLISNFDVRQSARGEEIDSLFNAKAIFSGANFGFLQQHHF